MSAVDDPLWSLRTLDGLLDVANGFPKERSSSGFDLSLIE